MTRKRLPAKPVLELDEKLVNLLRYYQMIDDELEKLQKPIYVSSMMDEIRAIEEMIVERLRWLFHDKYPRSKFIWGSMKPNKELPDRMPEKLQHAVRRYKERNGL